MDLPLHLRENPSEVEARRTIGLAPDYAAARLWRHRRLVMDAQLDPAEGTGGAEHGRRLSET